MAEEINIQAVIDQLVNRIAQLEFEVAVLKAMQSADPSSPPPSLPEEKSNKDNGGYV